MKYLWAVSWMTIKLQREQKKKQKFFMRLHFIQFNSSALIPLYCHNLYISVYFHSASWDTCGKKNHDTQPYSVHFSCSISIASNFMFNIFFSVCYLQLNSVIMIRADIRLDMFQNSGWLPINQRNWKIELRSFISSSEECHQQPPN